MPYRINCYNKNDMFFRIRDIDVITINWIILLACYLRAVDRNVIKKIPN